MRSCTSAGKAGKVLQGPRLAHAEQLLPQDAAQVVCRGGNQVAFAHVHYFFQPTPCCMPPVSQTWANVRSQPSLRSLWNWRHSWHATALAHIAAGGKAFRKQPAAKKDEKQKFPSTRCAVADQPLPAILTSRELEVLTHLARGLRVAYCARRLQSVTIRSKNNHKARIMGKLGIHKTVELTRFAIHHGIVSAS